MDYSPSLPGQRSKSGIRRNIVFLVVVGVVFSAIASALSMFSRTNLDTRSNAALSGISTQEIQRNTSSSSDVFDVYVDNSLQPSDVKYISFGSEVTLLADPSSGVLGITDEAPYEEDEDSELLAQANRFPAVVNPTIIPSISVCGKPCSTNSQCGGSGYVCYQQPMPACPPGAACPQVMPQKICRAVSCLTSDNCSCVKATIRPTSVPTPRTSSIPTATPNPVYVLARDGSLAISTEKHMMDVLSFDKPVIARSTDGKGYKVTVKATVKSASDPKIQQMLRTRSKFFTVRYEANPSGKKVQSAALTWRSIKGIRPSIPGVVAELTAPPAPSTAHCNAVCDPKVTENSAQCGVKMPCVLQNGRGYCQMPGCPPIPTQPTPPPTPSCIPRPACADGIPDPNGNIVYCDPQPGVVWCPPASPVPTAFPTPAPLSSCWNKVLAQNGQYYWPDGCRGNPNPAGPCIEALTPLTTAEEAGYSNWVAAGIPLPSSCYGQVPANPRSTPRPVTNPSPIVYPQPVIYQTR